MFAYNIIDFMIKNLCLKIVYKVLIMVSLSLFLCVGIATLSNLYLKQVVYPLSYKEQVFKYADKYNLERSLVFAVIKTESNFDKNAVSSAGAVGLMQITNSTAKYIATNLGEKEYQLTNPEINIKFGCYYLKYLHLKFENMETALVAYNAGEGNVLKWLYDKNFSTDGKSLKHIPFNESREYIKKIKRNTKKYNKLYNKILDK